MKKIFTAEIIANMPHRDLDDLAKNYLRADYGLTRFLSVIQIGLRLDEDYETYTKLLINELQHNIHFIPISLAAKSGWAIAVVLAENLNPKDYPLLKSEI